MKVLSQLLIISLTFSISSCYPDSRLVDKKKSKSYFYANFGKLAYCYHGNSFELSETVFSADTKSFKIITEDLAKDKNFIYYEGKKQPKIDTKSFYLDKDIPKDKNFAYKYDYNLRPLKYVDAKTYESLADEYECKWSRDKNNYYRDEEKVNVDRESFVLISRYFSKDKHNTYVDFSYRFFPIFNDSKNISKITSEYIKKNNNIYFVSKNGVIHIEKNKFKKIENIRILNKDIICINATVLVEGKKFKYSKVDAKSFKIFGSNTGRFSKDMNHVYYDQLIIKKANPKTFKILGIGYGKDTKHVFYENKLLKDADVYSFRREKNYSSIFIDNKGNRYEDGRKI